MELEQLAKSIRESVYKKNRNFFFAELTTTDHLNEAYGLSLQVLQELEKLHYEQSSLDTERLRILSFATESGVVRFGDKWKVTVKVKADTGKTRLSLHIRNMKNSAGGGFTQYLTR